MRGVILHGDRQVEMREFPDPRPGRVSQVIVKVKASGICGTDLALLPRLNRSFSTAEEPVISGHEPCGVVAEIGHGCSRSRSRELEIE